MSDPHAEKLDALMTLMFEYLRLLRSAGSTDLCDQVFESLLRVFETTILRTHKV